MPERTIVISPLAGLAEALAAHPDAFVCGLLGPEMPHPDLPLPGSRRLRLSFHDVAAPAPGYRQPSSTDVSRLLDFVRRWHASGAHTLVIHCWAGISRSTAAAFIARCALQPRRGEDTLAAELRRRAPYATPNPLLVRLADDLLRRNGRMLEAVMRIGRGTNAFQGDVTVWPLEEETGEKGGGRAKKRK